MQSKAAIEVRKTSFCSDKHHKQNTHTYHQIHRFVNVHENLPWFMEDWDIHQKDFHIHLKPLTRYKHVWNIKFNNLYPEPRPGTYSSFIKRKKEIKNEKKENHHGKDTKTKFDSHVCLNMYEIFYLGDVNNSTITGKDNSYISSHLLNVTSGRLL